MKLTKTKLTPAEIERMKFKAVIRRHLQRLTEKKYLGNKSVDIRYR